MNTRIRSLVSILFACFAIVAPIHGASAVQTRAETLRDQHYSASGHTRNWNWADLRDRYYHAPVLEQTPPTYENRPDTAAAWNIAKDQSTITEILHAWAGKDEWTTVGSHAPEVVDITDRARSALRSGVLDVSSDQIGATGGNNKHIGIVYRDATGVHFRRFYNEMRIRLPEIETWSHTFNSRAAGGLFVANQLEEPSRGLVTFHVESLMESGTGAQFWYFRHHPLGDNASQDYAGAYLSEKSRSRSRYQDLSKPENFGKHDTHARIHELAFQLHHNADWHYPFPPALRQHTPLTYYNEAGQAVSAPFNHDIDPSLASKEIPREGDFWFAMDKNRFLMGMGTPTSIADIEGTTARASILVDAQYQLHPGLRHFALTDYFRARFRNRGGNKTIYPTAPVRYSRIKSHVLHPSSKFNTPAYMMGKLLFWRNEWQTQDENSFALTFKAKGTHFAIGFAKDYQEHTADLAYSLEVTHDNFKVFRGNEKTNLTVALAKPQMLGGSDPTQYYDYWITYERGRISFGHGTTPGANTAATCVDSEPLPVKRYTFSSFNKPVDYTNIAKTSYSQTVTAQADDFAYSTWESFHKLSTPDSGGVIFSARNTSTTTDKTLLVGLRSTLPVPESTDTAPMYEVAWGAADNTAGHITRMGAQVKAQNGIDADSGQPVGAIAADTEWHDYWMSYAGGTIAYGKGRNIGVKTIDSWRDLSPMEGIKYFSFSSGTNTAEYKNIETITAASQNSYTATSQNSRYKDWMSGWQFSTENKGALTTVIKTDGTAQIGLATAGSADTAMANYDIILNDNNTAYIRKVGLKQAESETELSETQKPTLDGTSYWCLFNEGIIVIGTGTTVGAPASIILNWEDTEFIGTETPIKRFSFSNINSEVVYDNIIALTLSQIQSTLDAMEAALRSKEDQEAAWSADPTKQIITNMHAKKFFWHESDAWNENRRFAAKKKTSFTCKVKLMDTNDMTVLIGLSSSLTQTSTEEYNGAAYYIQIMGDGSLALMKAGTSLPLSTVTSDELAEMSDHRKSHYLWLTYDDGKFALGINSSLGVNPVWRFTDESPAIDVNFCGVGTDQATIQYTEITTSPFHDPTNYTTTDNARYSWHSDWKFPEQDKATITFTVQNPDPSKKLIGVVGLGSSILPAGPMVNAPYGGAMYSIIFDYTGKVFVRKQGQTGDKLGKLRPLEGSIELQRLMTLTDGSTHQCWLIYDEGGFMFGIDSQPGMNAVWEWVDDNPALSVGHFSFASFSSTMTLSDIAVAGGSEVQTLSRAFRNLEMALANPASDGYSHTNTVVMALSNAISMRMFKDDFDAFKNIVTIIVDNRELFAMDPIRKKHQRALMAESLGDILHEEISVQDKTWLQDAIAKLEGVIDLNERIQSYQAAFTQNINMFDSTDQKRILYMRKLASLGSMSPEQFQTQVDKNVEILKTLGSFIETIMAYLKEPSQDPNKALTQDERAILALLQLRAAAEQAIQHSQDPQYILDHLNDLPSIAGRVSTLQSLLNARQSNREDDPDGVLFTGAQITQFMSRFGELVDERHSLSATGVNGLKELIRTAKITPGFMGAESQFDTLQTRLSELLTIIDRPLEFAEILSKLTGRVVDVYTLTPDDSNFENRTAFLANLDGLPDAPGVTTAVQLQSVLDDIIKPFRERPTYSDFQEDVILDRVEQKVEALLKDNKSLEIVIMSSEDPAYIINNLNQLGLAETRVMRIISMFDLIRTATSMSLSPAQGRIVLEQLEQMVNARGEISDDTIKRVRLALQTARIVPGIAGDPVYEEQITNLRATLNEPVPFATLLETALSKIGTIMLKKPNEPERKSFMDLMTRMVASEDTKTNEQLNDILTKIIEELEGITLVNADDAYNDAPRIAQLRESIEMLLAGNKTFTSQLKIAKATKITLYEYAQALNRMLLEKDTHVTFDRDDLTTFVEQVAYVVHSRELLTSEQITTNMNNLSQFSVQTFIRSVQLNAAFEDSQDMADYFADITTPHEFRDRIEVMGDEVAELISSMPSAEDYFLKRLLTKIELLPEAPGLRTDKSFTEMEHNILIPLASLSILSDEDKARIQVVRKQLLDAKEQTLAEQRKFSHHFALAQEKIDDTNLHLNMLRSLILMQRQQEITEFEDDDIKNYTMTLQKLVMDRDSLTQEQTVLLGEVLNYSAGSSMYDTSTTQKNLITQLNTTLNDPEQVITLEQRILKYEKELAENNDLPILPSDDKLVRMPFFDKLARLRDPQVTGTLTPALATILKENIIPPLRNSKTDDREEEILAGLDEMLEEHASASGNVTYQLKYANDTHLPLFDYAKAVNDVITEKNKSLTFDKTDDERAMNALQYIADNRELLDSEQITTVQQLVRTIIWLGQLSEYATDLNTLLATLGEPHQFEDRIVYAAQELKGMIQNNVDLTSNRFTRFIAKLQLILEAPGVKKNVVLTPEEQESGIMPVEARGGFRTLETLIIAPLKMLDLPAERMQEVVELEARIINEKPGILAEQGKFSYHMLQAQEHVASTSRYINALKEVIANLRKDEVTATSADLTGFIRTLAMLISDRQAMSAEDVEALRTTINFTYYSPSFASHQNELLAMYNLAGTSVAFSDQIDQLVEGLEVALKPTTAPNLRANYFAKLARLKKIENDPEATIRLTDTDRLKESILDRVAHLPLTPEERANLELAQSFVAKLEERAQQLSFHMQILAKDISTAQADKSKDHIEVMIAGLREIITMRNADRIQFATHEYEQVVNLARELVTDRELFNSAQVSTVQGIIRSLQFGAGFEQFAEMLKQLHDAASTPWTFQERLDKYRTAFAEMNSKPTDSSDKNEYVSMVVTIFNAPGERKKADLEELKSMVLDPIKHGNFTAEQKNILTPIMSQYYTEMRNIKKLSYRLDRAQSTPTPAQYHAALTTILREYEQDKLIEDNAELTTSEKEQQRSIILEATDFDAIMVAFEQEVAMRPIIGAQQSTLFTAIQQLKNTRTFKDRIDYTERIKVMAEDVIKDADIATRAAHFANGVMPILEKDGMDGARQQFFYRMLQFRNGLAQLPTERLAATGVKDALQTNGELLGQYVAASGISPTEATTVQQTKDQMIALSNKAEQAAQAAAVTMPSALQSISGIVPMGMIQSSQPSYKAPAASLPTATVSRYSRR